MVVDAGQESLSVGSGHCCLVWLLHFAAAFIAMLLALNRTRAGFVAGKTSAAYIGGVKLDQLGPEAAERMFCAV